MNIHILQIIPAHPDIRHTGDAIYTCSNRVETVVEAKVFGWALVKLPGWFGEKIIIPIVCEEHDPAYNK